MIHVKKAARVEKLAPLGTGRVTLLPVEYHDAYFQNLTLHTTPAPRLRVASAADPPSLSPGSPLLFGRRGVHGDGSCFFHSLCCAKNTNNYLSRTPREQQQIGHKFRCRFIQHVTPERWAQFLRSHKLKTTVSFETLRKQFCNNNHWADELMIKLVSDVLHLNLIFMNGETRRTYCGVHGLRNEPMILILWLKHSHFEPVFCVRGVKPAGGSGGRVVRAQFMFDHEKDKNVIDAVFRNYKRTCRDVVL